jgi:hypothetical protein
MNIKPSNTDGFLIIKKYRFIPTFTSPYKTIIELELYNQNICVVSFYPHNKGNEKNKYKIRLNYKPGHIKAILKASLEAFFSLGLHEYAFIFNAANDEKKVEQYNSRYSAYLLFLENYYTDYNDCYKKGSITLNTYLVYHSSYEFKEQADIFYRQFEEKIYLENQLPETDK